MLLRYLNDCLSSILILGHLCLLWSIIFHNIAEMRFHLCFLEFLLFLICVFLFVLEFCTLLVGSYMYCGVQGGVKQSSMRDIIASPSQISTSPSSGGPCYNKRGTDDRKWLE
jgi:hypothetical protein